VSDSSKKPARRKRRPAVSGLLGLGLDNEDGHKRITTGEKFVLVGGSQETHEVMTETMVKTFEELKRRDKVLETVDHRELAEIIDRSRPR
jgi:heptaprenylglyceryl phosphate synthase